MSKLNSFKNICNHVETAQVALRRNSVILGNDMRGSIESFQWVYNTYNLNPKQKEEIKIFIDVMTAVSNGTKLKDVARMPGQSRERRKEMSKFLTRQNLRVEQ